MRGLKRIFAFQRIEAILVASFTDAWIETLNGKERDKTKQSHLLQMRGLKP